MSSIHSKKPQSKKGFFRGLYEKALWLLCVLLACAGCAAPADSAQEDSLAKGTVYETEKFSVTCAPGWNKMDIEGSMLLYSDDKLLQISVRGYGLTEQDK